MGLLLLAGGYKGFQENGQNRQKPQKVAKMGILIRTLQRRFLFPDQPLGDENILRNLRNRDQLT